jgi:hypothetical protein
VVLALSGQHEDAWQAKFIFDSDDLLDAMRSSLDTVRDKRPNVRTLTFCLPLDLADDSSRARGEQLPQKLDSFEREPTSSSTRTATTIKIQAPRVPVLCRRGDLRQSAAPAAVRGAIAHRILIGLGTVNRDPLFDSAWLKWGRAIHHAKTLQTELDEASANSGPLVSVRTEYQSRRHGFAVCATEVRDAPAEWGLLVGDVAFNYRSALDHGAWALVTKNRRPPEILTDRGKKGVYFPIVRKRSDFRTLTRASSAPTCSCLGPRGCTIIPAITLDDDARVAV